MEAIGRFLFEFFGQFFEGAFILLKGVFDGIIKSLNVFEYADTVGGFVAVMGWSGWVIAIVSIIIMLMFMASSVYACVIAARRLAKLQKKTQNTLRCKADKQRKGGQT